MKNKAVSKFTIFIMFILIATFSYGKKQLLKEYKFEEGGFSLIGLISESDQNDLADSLGNFYTDEIEILNLIKKAWVFNKPSPKYACGYHYIVKLCKNGLEIERFFINLNCNEIACNKGFFYFDTDLLRQFQSNFKKPYHKDVNFKTIIEARNFRDSILNESNIIVVEHTDLTNFEGNFMFTFNCPEGSKTCLSKEEKILTQLNIEIKNNYQNEHFELEGVGGSIHELFIEVKCNKSLFDKFNLYSRDVNYGKWEPYNLLISCYWK